MQWGTERTPKQPTARATQHIQKAFTSLSNGESSLKELSEPWSADTDSNLGETECLRDFYWQGKISKDGLDYRLLSFVTQIFLHLSLAKKCLGIDIPRPFPALRLITQLPLHITAFQLTSLPSPGPTPGPLYMLFLLLKMSFLPLSPINTGLNFQDLV